LTNKTKAWNKIFDSLKDNGVDIQTWSKRDGDGDYFHAAAFGGEIIVTQSDKEPSCRIDSGRPITYLQFERVADVFSQYITGEIKRKDMRYLGWNTSYIISLIVRLL
jgi:hypothetical protein